MAGKKLGKLQLRRTQQFHLKYRLMAISIAVFLAPTLFFSVVLMNHFREYRMEQAMKSNQSLSQRGGALVEQNAQACLLTSQSFLNNRGLSDGLAAFREPAPIHALDLLQFKRTEVRAGERLVSSNGLLYQVRIYLDNDKVPEMMPLIYNQSRLERQAWYHTRGELAGWKLDYEDRLFSPVANNYSRKHHLAALVSPYFSQSGSVLGILEVATTMELLFPPLYQNDGKSWSGFLTQEGTLYYQEEDAQWMPPLGDMLQAMEDRDKAFTVVRTGQASYVLSYTPLAMLPGGMVTCSRLDDELQALASTQSLLVLGILLLSVCFCFSIGKLMDVVLARFYRVVSAIEAIQTATLPAPIPESGGQDEIGLLATAVDRMKDRISTLVSESVERERVVKDAQIRGLQNQINAHFIYNTLESIKMMAEVEEKYEISDAVTALGKLLRYTLKNSSPLSSSQIPPPSSLSGGTLVPLEEELAYVRNYLILMGLRMDNRVQLQVEVPPALLSLPIPKLSLQPIVENALCHGLEGLPQDGQIAIKAWEEGGNCRITVTDWGRGMSPQAVAALLEALAQGKQQAEALEAGHGIGLVNVQNRIRLFFGEGYGLTIASVAQVSTQVEMMLPGRQNTQQEKG